MSPTAHRQAGPQPAAVVGGLGIVYVVWATTFLGIRVMVESMPPLWALGSRFVAGGLLLAALLWARRGVDALRLSPPDIVKSCLLGALMLAVGNGFIAMGLATGISSGLSALLVATVPVWTVLLRAATGNRPDRWNLAGVCAGLAGLIIMLRPDSDGGTDVVGALIVLAGSWGWAVGGFTHNRLPRSHDSLGGAVYQMLGGGIVNIATGTLLGERVNPSAFTAPSIAAWLYLVLVGSVISYGAFVWTLDNVRLSLVSMYAYINPVVAVALGAWLLDEPIKLAQVLGGMIVLIAVGLVARGNQTDQPPSHPNPRRETGPGGDLSEPGRCADNRSIG